MTPELPPASRLTPECLAAVHLNPRFRWASTLRQSLRQLPLPARMACLLVARTHRWRQTTTFLTNSKPQSRPRGNTRSDSWRSGTGCWPRRFNLCSLRRRRGSAERVQVYSRKTAPTVTRESRRNGEEDQAVSVIFAIVADCGGRSSTDVCPRGRTPSSPGTRATQHQTRLRKHRHRREDQLSRPTRASHSNQPWAKPDQQHRIALQQCDTARVMQRKWKVQKVSRRRLMRASSLIDLLEDRPFRPFIA